MYFAGDRSIVNVGFEKAIKFLGSNLIHKVVHTFFTLFDYYVVWYINFFQIILK